MDNTQPTLFDGDIGPVRYTFQVPGLSFEHYCNGNRIALQPLVAKKKSLLQPITNLVLWIIIAVGVMLSIQTIRGEFNSGLLGTYFFVFILLLLVPGILGTIINKREVKRPYLDQPSCQHGYRIILGEKGLKSITPNGIGIYPWQSVTDFANYKNIDYIVLYPNGFLWIPESLEGYNSVEVSAFILQKMATESDTSA